MTSPTKADDAQVARRVWSRSDKRRVLTIFSFIAVLHIVGWATLVAVTRGSNGLGPARGFGFGLGATAYVLGMRHAFDVDHIVAIDNTARKLIGEGRRPLTVGFWFSLGHSTVVFVLCLLLGAGVRAIAGDVTNDASALHQTTAIVGATVSGVFLILVGIINARSFLGITRMAKRVRGGTFDDAELERHLGSRGFIARILGKVTKTVRKDWHMYPVGLLFGLGFDTATEVSLLVLSSSAAAFNLPWYAVLTLPVLFAAGMSLLDAADGVLMSAAYEWAFLSPARRIYYNLVITGLSVTIALLAGLIGLSGMLAGELGVSSGPLAWTGDLDLDNVGYGIVGLFVFTWIISAVVWKVGKIEERWRLRPAVAYHRLGPKTPQVPRKSRQPSGPPCRASGRPAVDSICPDSSRSMEPLLSCPHRGRCLIAWVGLCSRCGRTAS